MSKTVYGIQATFYMNEFSEKHVCVCKQLFETKQQAEDYIPTYLDHVVQLADWKKCLFTLNRKTATADILDFILP